MAYTLLDYLRTGARANHLANRRLHAAIGKLDAAEFQAPRTGFFPSLAATLNHILEVDLYYVAALHGESAKASQRSEFRQHVALAPLVEAQSLSDLRLIRYCDALDAETLDAIVALDRTDHTDFNTVSQTLAHLAMHQTHHRGQVHAMLSATAVEPPQLDEFLMPSDARCRVDDMQRLGWSERQLFGDGADPAKGV